jgi:hypothetical protein
MMIHFANDIECYIQAEVNDGHSVANESFFVICVASSLEAMERGANNFPAFSRMAPARRDRGSIPTRSVGTRMYGRKGFGARVGKL